MDLVLNDILEWSEVSLLDLVHYSVYYEFFYPLVGGNIILFTELYEQTRVKAFDMMVSHADEVGANAVIEIRYDATKLMGGLTEVLCYGTAVVVSSQE